MGDAQLQAWQLLQQPAEHQVGDHDRGVVRVPEQVGEVVVLETLLCPHIVGVGEYEDTQLAGPLQKWPKGHVGELRALDGGSDLYRPKPIGRDYSFELRDRRFGVLHRHTCHPTETSGFCGDQFADTIVDEPRYVSPGFGVSPVVEKGRGR